MTTRLQFAAALFYLAMACTNAPKSTPAVGSGDPGIEVNAPSVLKTFEDGDTDSFQVRLLTQPTAKVRLTFASTLPSEGKVTPSELTFTSDNWFDYQAVTVIGQDDQQSDGAVAYTIEFQPSESEDSRYRGLVAGPLNALNEDNELDQPTHTRWEKRNPSAGQNAPPARSDHALAYDAQSEKTILFGGNDSASALQDTWEFGTTWTQRSPTASPSSRSSARLFFDSSRKKVLLFGGAQASELNDLWEWNADTGTWTELPRPTPAPLPRRGHAIVFDSARNKAVLFGGKGGSNLLADTWEWDSATNTWLNRSPPVTSPNPSPRELHAMAYDSQNQKVVLFGGVGYLNSLVANETYEWDGKSGNWTRRTPTFAVDEVVPSARQKHVMAFDSKRGRTLLLGGTTASAMLNDNWFWDSAKGVWKNHTPSSLEHLPTPRTSAAMVYDSKRDVFVLFGGTQNSTPLNDLWEMTPP